MRVYLLKEGHVYPPMRSASMQFVMVYMTTTAMERDGKPSQYTASARVIISFNEYLIFSMLFVRSRFFKMTAWHSCMAWSGAVKRGMNLYLTIIIMVLVLWLA